MALEPSKPSKHDTLPQRKLNIPVQITDLSMFDNSFAFMKKQFNEQMRRMDEEMLKFSRDLNQFFGAERPAIQTGFVSAIPKNMVSQWQNLQNSPLVEGEGNNKILKLQFDLSQFEPTEIKVKVLNDMLIISAHHEEMTKDSTVYREYSRQFKLPPYTNPELVVSSLSGDGVLTVQAPLVQPVTDCLPAPDN